MSTRALRKYLGPHGQGGQAVVLLAMVMMALLFAVGLAIDSGQLYAAKRAEQEAADAAAFAGAVVIFQNPLGDPISAARGDGVMHGFTGGCALSTAGACTDNTTNTTVTVNRPPLSGNYIGLLNYVEVIIQRQVKTSLVPAEAAFNPVTARSVAGSDPAKSPFAIVALKTTGPCITMGGSGSVTVPNGVDLGGKIQANCTGTSVQFNGTGTITDSLGVRTVGTVSDTSKVLPNAGLVQNVSKEPDQFVGFPKPDPTGMPVFNNVTVPNSACNGATPLTPGVYVGGITNTQNCDVYLGNGVFILQGGGFQQNSSSGNIVTVPRGAMIFNTHSNYPGAKGAGSCASVQAQSGGGFNVWAIDSGTYQGMAFY